MKVLTTPRSYGKTDPEVFAMLRAAGLEVVRNETGGILDKEGMKALLADCDGVIVGVDPIDAEVIAAAPKLKAIAKYGVGVDNIDLDAAKARDIKVSRTVGANAEAVADYAMALLLAVARKTVLIDQHCRQGDWKKITTRDVTGGTIGILGLGAIGRNVAQRAQGFGMKVLAHDPFWDEAYAKAHGITRAAPDEIFAECDVISLHLPLTPETENFIGAAELADGAKGTVRTWQELRVGSKGGYAALSPGKGTAQPRVEETQHTWKGKPVSKKQVTRWLERGHGTRRPAAGSSRSCNQAGRAGVTRASAAGYVKGRQFYSWTKAKALELALKAADRVLSRIADEVDY